uniref:Uncharacterized protein n=1 Tax=Parascaris univalens TaxID=6257 RepID=A0A914ZM99_PARUN
PERSVLLMRQIIMLLCYSLTTVGRRENLSCDTIKCKYSFQYTSLAIFGITQRCVMYFTELNKITADFDRILRKIDGTADPYDCSTADPRVQLHQQQFFITDYAKNRVILPFCSWQIYREVLFCKILWSRSNVQHVPRHPCLILDFEFNETADSLTLYCRGIRNDRRKFRQPSKARHNETLLAQKLQTCVDENESRRKFFVDDESNVECLFALSDYASNSNVYLLWDEVFIEKIMQQLRHLTRNSFPFYGDADDDLLSIMLYMRRTQIEEKRSWMGAVLASLAISALPSEGHFL